MDSGPSPRWWGGWDKLEASKAIDHWKARGLDLTALLHKPDVPEGVATHHTRSQDHGLDAVVDRELIARSQAALENGTPVTLDLPIRNSNRTTGAMLSGEVSSRYGEAGLPDDTIRVRFKGSAGQSFGAFLARGVSLSLEGDTNDYLAKGLSGGRVVVYPPKDSTFTPEDNIITGNVVLYGATAGEAFICGVAGERFAVRNSGARAVVEGVGDHGCEYMTKGVVVVLGPTGRNFAAGMSGGFAYVLDLDGGFASRCNAEMVDLEPVVDREDVDTLRGLVEDHHRHTNSPRAREVLDSWDSMLPRFVKVCPRAFNEVLEKAKPGEVREAVSVGDA